MNKVSESHEVDSVIIVEDHRDAANILLEVAQGTFPSAEVQLSHTFAEGLEYLQSRSYSIALLDLGLPDGDGLDLIKYAAKNHRSTLIIVTTIFDDEEHLFDALRSGASGYLLKGHSPEELANYLGEAVAGRPALSPRIAQSMLGFFRNDKEKVTEIEEQELLVDLTQRELDVLSLIAKGFGVKEVSELLDISSNTVSHHIKNLYSKLNVHNRAEATAAAVQLNIFNP